MARALAEEPQAVVPPEERSFRGGSMQTILSRLDARAEFQRKGDNESADGELRRIVSLAGELGARNVPLASQVLIDDARRAMAAGRPERAALFAEVAVKLSPELAAAHWMQAETFLTYNFSVVSAVFAAARAVLTRGSGFRNQLTTLTDLLAMLSISMLLSLVLFVLIQLAKYIRYAAYDIEQRTDFSMVQSWLGVVALLLAPLCLTQGLVPALLLFLALLGIYQTSDEVKVTVLGLSFLGLSPLIAYLFAVFIGFHGSSVDKLAVASSEIMTPQLESELMAMHDDPDAAFLVGTRLRRLGRLGAAERWLRRSLELDPKNRAARNNLANVLYELDQFDKAEEAYREAMGRSQPEPRLNLAALLIEQGKESHAKNFLREARELAPELYQAAAVGRARGRFVIDMPFSELQLWVRLFKQPPEELSPLMSHLWRLVGGRVPWLAIPIASVLLGLLVFTLRSPKRHFSAPCVKCGRATDRALEIRHCDLCAQAFGPSAMPGEQDKRLRREALIRRSESRRRITRIVLGLVAGAGHFMSGRAVAGLILALSLFGALINIAWADLYSVHAWALWSGPPSVRLWFSVPIIVVATMLSLVGSIRGEQVQWR